MPSPCLVPLADSLCHADEAQKKEHAVRDVSQGAVHLRNTVIWGFGLFLPCKDCVLIQSQAK